jgi:hypothetical protein
LSSGKTTLKILNTKGQEMATLFNGETKSGEYNQIQFNSDKLAKGVYFSKLANNGNVNLMKMQLAGE